ncbi:hypothetical protein WJX72_001247 [[Myrmecia] bisecta]|uniref:EF-hand domain-containing protein n=1 Tax=[Myrmecia] bisecta TaxID=41462 RepID=A0AAW1R4X5_9CHLO
MGTSTLLDRAPRESLAGSETASPRSAKQETASVRSARRASVSLRSGNQRKGARRSSAGTGSAPKASGAVINLVAEATPAARPLPTKAEIMEGLAVLGSTADGLQEAFLQLKVEGTGLTKADCLAPYAHVQTLLLRGNELADIRACGSMQSLTHLDASHNALTQLLDIQPPPRNLRFADLSYNRLSQVQDVPSFARLATLNLDGNMLPGLGGLGQLTSLRALSVCHNQLVCCKGLETLTGLRELALSGNQLTCLYPLTTLASLEVLRVSHNPIQGLRPLSRLTALRTLDASHAALASLETLAPLQQLPALSWLSTANNLLEEALDARLHTIHLLSRLTSLNSLTVSVEDRVDAGNLYGADHEGQQAIRHLYFPSGELENGGGAPLPVSAGLAPSDRQDEQGCDFTQVEATVRGVPEDVLEKGTAGIAEYLLRKCAAQLDRAYAVYCWVVAHVQLPPHAKPGDCRAAVFAKQYAALEEAFLGADAKGTWAEKVAGLFVRLAKACILEAVAIPGFWKSGEFMPGDRCSTHNHCWAAVKANGGWRLVDPAWAASSRDPVDFYTAPSAFVFSHCPLLPCWQLLEPAVPLNHFWDLPQCHQAFFSRGLRLMRDDIQAVNILPAPTPGAPLPTFCLPIVAPKGTPITQALLNNRLHSQANSGACVFQQHAPHRLVSKGSDFCQAVAEPAAEPDAGGAEEDLGDDVEHELWAACPSPGDWYMCVSATKVLKGAIKMNIHGLDQPLILDVDDVMEVMRIKIVIPPVQSEPDEEPMPLGSAGFASCLPQPSAAFHQRGCQLVIPRPSDILEGDKAQFFQLVAPGGRAVRVHAADAAADGAGSSALEPVAYAIEGTYIGTAVLPRCPECAISADFGTGAWLPLVLFQLRPPTQALTVTQGLAPLDEEALAAELQEDPDLMALKERFDAIDANGDGLITRGELMVALRRQPDLAAELELPSAVVRAGDASFEAFNEAFLAINEDKQGKISWPQFAAYFGFPSPPPGSDDEKDSEWSEEA